MVVLSSAHDYVVLFGFAAIFGAIGGIAYELVQTRANDTGSLELPWFRGWRYFDLGFISSMLLGAIAAVAISYFFTPEVQVKATVKHVAVIRTEWQIAKVIPLSLIVGSAGGAFLEAMRGRVLGQLNAQKVAATQAAGKAAVEQVAAVAKAAVAGQLEKTGSNILAGASATIANAAAEVPAPLDRQLRFVADVAGGPSGTDLIGDLPPAKPLSTHIGNVGETVHLAVATAKQAAADIIDQSIDSAHAAIDAAANTNPT